MAIPCKWIESLLNSYIDGELNPAKRILVSRHLKKCARCKSAACELSRAKAAVKDKQSVIEAPAYLREAISHNISVRSQSRFGWESAKWAFKPEFSWGLATILILTVLISYLIFIKPDVSACSLITTITADAENPPPAFDVSSVLNYFGKTQNNLLQSVSLTIQHNDCKGDASIILYMTVKIGDEILVYTHGNPTDIKTIALSGAMLKKITLDGNDFFVGDFSGIKVVCWNLKKNPYAIALKEV